MACFRYGGRRYRKQGFLSRADAQRFIDGIIESGAARGIDTVEGIIAEYLRWSEQDKKKSYAWVLTCRQMLAVFTAHLKAAGVKYPDQIKIDQFQTFRTEFARSAKRSDATWEKYRQGISAFLNWANKRDRRIVNYAADEDFKIKFQLNPPDTLDLPEVEKILKFFDSRGGPAPVAFRLLLFTGLRLGELMNLKITDVDLENKTLTAGTKTKEARTVPLPGVLIPYLKPSLQGPVYVLDDGTGDRLYHRKHWYRLLQEACATMEIQRHSIHSLRHTFVRYLLEAGVELNLVAKLCGHKDIRTTMRYAAHYSLSNAREAVNKLPFDRNLTDD